MLDYWVRSYRDYEIPVIQYAIFLCETNEEIPTEFRAPNTWHRYNVIKMWEQDPEPFLNTPGLLPLATLARSERPEALLEEIAELVMQVESVEQQRELVGCASLLAGLRFEKELIKSLFREEIMQESVIYQDIIQRGIRQGIQQGIQQGELMLVRRQLARRFGALTPEMEARICALETPLLDALSEALLDFQKPSDLEEWLARNAPQVKS